MEHNKKEYGVENLNSVDISNYPITTTAIKFPKLAVFLQILLHCVSLLLPLVFILTFFESAMNSQYFHWRVLILFVDVFAWWWMYLLSSLSIGKLFLIILNLLCTPKEGVFKLNDKNLDYYFFCLRLSVKKVIFWIWNNFCFPWVANFAFKICDISADFKSTLFDGWASVEFVDFGRNIMLGQGALVASSMIVGDSLIIKKVVIGDHVVLGGNSIVAPGTIIGKNTTLGVFAVTHINQVLEPNWIYVGRPAKKYQLVSEERKLAKTDNFLTKRIVDKGEKIPLNKTDE
ncbi:MAG: hypothetical protein BAJALOKI1v1_1220011 [Promethearchaeota archaeon]|nr:MAG: hypothetical protein BAJALOKI1v1_1220011 [Candidatus Lokiarchaeota archaeon]